MTLLTQKHNALDLPCLAEPTRTGYEFLGWYETADFSGEPVTVLDENAGNKTYMPMKIT